MGLATLAPVGFAGAEVVGLAHIVSTLARIIHERSAFVHNAPAAMGILVAAGFDTAPSAVLKTSPGLSEGPA
jgi:hypothetical protein